jgi:anti-anti-sigma regulatory factor
MRIGYPRGDVGYGEGDDSMNTWARLIAPQSKDQDQARSEQLFNGLLLGGLLLMGPALVAVVIRALLNPAGIPPAIVMGISYALVFLLYGLSRAGRWQFACQLIVLLLVGAGVYTLVIAGIGGSGGLYLLLAATVVSVLIDGTLGLVVVAVGIAVYFLLGLAVEQGFIVPSLEPSVAVDGAIFAAIGLVMMVILWASNRELSRSLARARQQADDLRKAAEDERMMLSEVMTMTQEQSQLLGLVEELTLPVVRLYHGVLLLPVVGALDTHRAARLTQELLQAVADQRAEVAIIDITGVPHLEAPVAEQLVQMAEAVGYMGCQLVLVGIRPRLARVLAKLRLAEAGVVTFANLQNGLEHALGAVQHRIVEVVPEEAR